MIFRAVKWSFPEDRNHSLTLASGPFILLSENRHTQWIRFDGADLHPRFTDWWLSFSAYLCSDDYWMLRIYCIIFFYR